LTFNIFSDIYDSNIYIYIKVRAVILDIFIISNAIIIY
jgi:hypothetical protein